MTLVVHSMNEFYQFLNTTSSISSIVKLSVVQPHLLLQAVDPTRSCTSTNFVPSFEATNDLESIYLHVPTLIGFLKPITTKWMNKCTLTFAKQVDKTTALDSLFIVSYKLLLTDEEEKTGIVTPVPKTDQRLIRSSCLNKFFSELHVIPSTYPV